jgi:hypothetical protein
MHLFMYAYLYMHIEFMCIQYEFVCPYMYICTSLHISKMCTGDVELESDVKFLHDILVKNYKDLSTFDKWSSEVHSGALRYKYICVYVYIYTYINVMSVFKWIALYLYIWIYACMHLHTFDKWYSEVHSGAWRSVGMSFFCVYMYMSKCMYVYYAYESVYLLWVLYVYMCI